MSAAVSVSVRAHAATGTRYGWAGVSPPVSAFAFADFVQTLAVKLGRDVEPHDLVEDARDKPGHLLHRCFEWREAEAAEQYRIGQAANLLRHLRVEIVTSGAEIVTVRALVRLPEESDGYRFMSKVLRDPDQHRQVLEQAARELAVYLDKFLCVLVSTGKMQPFRQETESFAERLHALFG